MVNQNNKTKQNIKLSIALIAVFFISLNSLFSQEFDHWEMIVAAEDSWNYFPGNAEPPVNWTDLNFDASQWAVGQGGFGYGDNDDRTIINAVPSVYLRTKFNITDSSKIIQAILNIDYDDAFVAYLNSHEIARANIGTVGIRPTYSTYADTYHEAQMYSGGKAETFIINQDSLLKYLTSGENVLAVEVHNYNATSSDLSSIVYFSVGLNDSSHDYRAEPDWFEAPYSEELNLPLVIIETAGQSIVDEPKITANLKVVDNGSGELNNFFDSATDYNSYIGIEIRGQSSQMFPKKSFSVETRDSLGEGRDVNLLGLPKEEDWVLYAPYSDKTMLRNAITYQLGSKMGNWQPHFKFCELYINGDYRGVYLLIEKIKRDKNRVDINKLKPDEVAGDDLTGGYIVKVDKIQDLTSNEYFYTYPSNRYYNARNYAFTYVYPKYDKIVNEQKAYIKNFLTYFQNNLNGNSFKDPDKGYQKYIDVNSFVDFQIINELSNNVDGYRYSTYFYKKKDSKGGKLYAGPLWDFNLAYGNVDYSPSNLATQGWLYTHYGPNEGYPMHWWARLMEDPNYQNAVYKRWSELRTGAFSNDSILSSLDAMKNHMGAAIDRNFERWPIIGQYVWPNYDYTNSNYDEELAFMKEWLIERMNWMDEHITSTTGISDLETITTQIHVFPNPSSDYLNIPNYSNLERIDIYSLSGKKVKTFETVRNQISIQNLKPGFYLLRAQSFKGSLSFAKIIKKQE